MVFYLDYPTRQQLLFPSHRPIRIQKMMHGIIVTDVSYGETPMLHILVQGPERTWQSMFVGSQRFQPVIQLMLTFNVA